MFLFKKNSIKFSKLILSLLLSLSFISNNIFLISSCSNLKTVVASHVKTARIIKKCKIYNRNGHEIYQKRLKKGKIVKIYRTIYIKKNKYYFIGKGRYVGAANIRISGHAFKESSKYPSMGTTLKIINDNANDKKVTKNNEDSISDSQGIINIGKYGNCPMTFDTSTGTLHISSGDDGNKLRGSDDSIASFIYQQRSGVKPSDIKKISIDNLVSLPSNCEAMFANLENLEQITGLSNVDTTDISDLSYMFANDYKLESLDLSTWNMVNISADYMFSNDRNLNDLNLRKFDDYYSCKGIFSGVNQVAIKELPSDTRERLENDEEL